MKRTCLAAISAALSLLLLAPASIALSLLLLAPASTALSLLLTPAHAAPPSQTSFTIGQTSCLADDQSLPMPAAPFLEQDRAYLPLRYLALALGIPESGISYNDGVILLQTESQHIQLAIGSNRMVINGKPMKMEGALILRQDRAFLPARPLAEAMGYATEWQPESQTVRFTRKAAAPQAQAREIFDRGLFHYKNDQLEAASRDFLRAIELDPDSGDAYGYLGRTYYLMFREQEALPLLEKALQLNPADANAHAGIAQCYAALGEPEKALEHLDRAVGLEPENPRHLANRAEYYLFVQIDPPKAWPDIQTSLLLQPDFINGLVAKADYYARKQLWDKAEELLAQAVAASPQRGFNHPRDLKIAFDARRVFYDQRKEYQKGLENQDKFIELFPDEAQAYAARGYFLDLLGRLDEAIASVHKALELDPDNALAYLNLAYFTFEKKDYDQAIAYANKAIELNPFEGINYNNRGLAYFEKGEYELARKDLLKAQLLGGLQSDGHLYLGRLYLTIDKDYPRARAEFEQAIVLKDDYGLAYLYLGDTLKLLGETEASQAAYRKALDLNVAEAAERLK